MLNLYRISQTVNRGYDTYSDAVVAAETPDDARRIHPYTGWGDTRYHVTWRDEWAEPWDVDAVKRGAWVYVDERGSENEAYERQWADRPNEVTVELVGVAAAHVQPGVVCASFHAG